MSISAEMIVGVPPDVPVGGPLPSGAWVKIPSIYRLLLSGTGTVVIDARNRAGTVTTQVASYAPSAASNQLKYPYFGAETVSVRATLTGSATAEVI